LLNILPKPVADRLKQSPEVIAERFEAVTVLFADIVGFTTLSAQVSPEELVRLLNDIFSCFDGLADKYGLEKIKTIGDAYMAVAGLPMPRPNHAAAAADMALEMQREIATQAEGQLQARIGMHTGPVVAGVIGKKKFSYDLWGDTVNTASRMESHSIPGQIQVTQATYEFLQGAFLFEARGKIQVKGKGELTTYLLIDKQDTTG
jgi:class 3 adenylate cyclase